MSCDCINRLEALLTEDMKKKFPGFDVEEKVEFQNKTLLFSKNKAGMILSNPVFGKMKRGKQTRKYEVSMLPRYCPYCGKPLDEKGGEQ